MNLKARYHALVEFLLPYQEIWRNEIMLQYPSSLEAYNPQWIQELRPCIKPDKAWPLIQGKEWDNLSPELANFHKRIVELTTFPVWDTTDPLPVNARTWLHIIPKKQHEIERLAPFIAERMNGQNNLIDIGGGQGHLAQTLAHHYGYEVTSMDMDPNLQKIGERWQKTKWANSPHTIKFKPHRIQRKDSIFADLMSAKTLTSGLHTCGSLAVAHMEASILSGATLVNMPCCYHKTELSDCNLSIESQTKPISWNQYSLTLAAGPHRKVSLEDIEFRNQIKRCRYSLHFLLTDQLGIKGQVKLGPCPPELYYDGFAKYAREQFKRLKLEVPFTDDFLETYYSNTEHHNLIENMLAAALLRDTIGRVLEVAIILDRALWMQEHHFEVDILELFDPKVSPRNLVLHAKRSDRRMVR